MSKPNIDHPWRRIYLGKFPEVLNQGHNFVKSDRALSDRCLSTDADGVDHGGVASPFKTLDEYDRRNEDIVPRDD